MEHAMNILERVVEGRVRKIVKIDSMQFGFVAGRSMTDAIFIVLQLCLLQIEDNACLFSRRNF